VVVANVAALIAEAKGLDLFRPHGAFEVHCAHCHARLNGDGDCATCGLIGRPATELERRATTDPDKVTKLLEGAIAKRRAYQPAAKA
jgi:hypothetical protein